MPAKLTREKLLGIAEAVYETLPKRRVRVGELRDFLCTFLGVSRETAERHMRLLHLHGLLNPSPGFTLTWNEQEVIRPVQEALSAEKAQRPLRRSGQQVLRKVA